MMGASYFEWLLRDTPTTWWHDSADPGELARAMARGAIGVTTNPVLCQKALAANRKLWSRELQDAVAGARDPARRASSLVKVVVGAAAQTMLPLYQ